MNSIYDNPKNHHTIGAQNDYQAQVTTKSKTKKGSKGKTNIKSNGLNSQLLIRNNLFNVGRNPSINETNNSRNNPSNNSFYKNQDSVQEHQLTNANGNYSYQHHETVDGELRSTRGQSPLVRIPTPKLAVNLSKNGKSLKVRKTPSISQKSKSTLLNY